jgi:four helix bundle protein
MKTYAVSAYFKSPEAWPLRDQLFRAAISVPSNIAEGAGRGSDADFRRFLFHSMGSLNEAEYDLFLARELGFLPPDQYKSIQETLVRVRQMLSRLVRKLKPQPIAHSG